jgi:NlpC/P60 family putative phage cell wall peptidase
MAAASSTDLRAAVAAEARSWIGTPYRHLAGADPVRGVACDCLGLIRGVWLGVYGVPAEKPPAYSPDWAEGTRQELLLDAARRLMREIPVTDARAGHMIVFRWRPHLPAKHAGILVSDDPRRLVHAYDSARKVAEVNLAPQWRQRLAAAFAFPET